MLPLGILNASTRNVRITPKSTTDTTRILHHSHRNPRLDRLRFSSRNAPLRCSAVISRVARSGGAADVTPGSWGRCDESSKDMLPRVFECRCRAITSVGESGGHG